MDQRTEGDCSSKLPMVRDAHICKLCQEISTAVSSLLDGGEDRYGHGPHHTRDSPYHPVQRSRGK
eukprot:3025390-Prorocentrum_lima.AAC.1